MILSQDLSLRYNAKVLFDKIESLPKDHITVDFKNVRTMTRSFAQEYLSRKERSQKATEEINVSKNIRRMFKVVETVFENTQLFDSKNLTIIDME
jgi:hypothetical protein